MVYSDGAKATADVYSGGLSAASQEMDEEINFESVFKNEDDTHDSKPDVTHGEDNDSTMQASEEDKDKVTNKEQTDNGYGSMQSSSNGQSHRSSSCSGGGSLTKSRNSGSSHSSGFCEHLNKKIVSVLPTLQQITLSTSTQTNIDDIQCDQSVSCSKLKNKTIQIKEISADHEPSTPVVREMRSKEENFRDQKRKKVDDYQCQAIPLPANVLTCSEPSGSIAGKEALILSPRSMPPLFVFSGQNQTTVSSTVNFTNQKTCVPILGSSRSAAALKSFMDTSSCSNLFSIANHVSDSEPEIIATSNAYVVTPPSTVNQAKRESTDDHSSVIYTQALNYIKRIKEKVPGQLVNNPDLVHHPSCQHDEITEFIKNFGGNQNAFTMVLNIRDGTVISVTTNITEVLGFPEDMIVGHPFIDFVYPRDSYYFSSNIINGMSPFMRSPSSRGNISPPPFYCRVRECSSNYVIPSDVKEINTYNPCKITLKINKMEDINKNQPASVRATRLPTSDDVWAEVMPVPSFYKVPDQDMHEGHFMIRHTASCNFSDYDPDAIPFLGHLPQDLTGNSIFDCYHPEDLPLLLTIYREIIRKEGKPFRSESYRFRTFNGSWVVLETEWICFVNPWTRKVDSIIGQHTVIKGPRDISIYMERCHSPFGPSNDVSALAREAQQEIIELLSKPVGYESSSKGSQGRRRSTLTEMMSCLVNDIHNQEKKNTADVAAAKRSQVSVVASSGAGITSVAAPSVVTTTHPCQPLISAEHCRNIAAPPTSKGESLLSSSESPSTYSRLNYSATLLRFFQSNPRTTSTDASANSKVGSSGQGSSEDAKSTSPKRQKLSACRPVGASTSHYVSGYDSGSDDTLNKTRKCESKDIPDGGSGECASDPSSRSGGVEPYEPVPLTEEVLNRHNQEMQMLFTERQRKEAHVNRKERKQSDTILGRKVKNAKNFSKTTSPTRFPVKRPHSPITKDSRPMKIAFLEPPNTSVKGDTAISGILSSTSQPHLATKQTVNSFHSGSSCRAVQATANDAKTANPGLIASELEPPVFVPQLPYCRMDPPSIAGPKLVLHEQQHSIGANTPNPFSGTPILMGHPSPYIQSQAFPLPLPYMGGYTGMYLPPVPFTQAVFGSQPMVIPNMMLSHPHLPQQQYLLQPTAPPSSLADHSSSALPIIDPQLPGNIDCEIMEIAPGSRHKEQDRIIHQQPYHKPPHALVQLRKRSDSRATSVKVEPGSVLGSVASVSGQIRCSLSHPPESLRSEVGDVPTENLVPCSTITAPKRVLSIASHFSRSTSVLGEAESISSPSKRQFGQEENQGGNSDMAASTSSPAEDSTQLLSETSAETNETISGNPGHFEDRPVLNDPMWLANVEVTPQLLYQYQLHTENLGDVLQKDMNALKALNQPVLVEDQLSSLCQELDIDGEHLHLDEGITSSSGEEIVDGSTKSLQDIRVKVKRKYRPTTYFSKQAIIYEVEAAVPSPEDVQERRRVKQDFDINGHAGSSDIS